MKSKRGVGAAVQIIIALVIALMFAVIGFNVLSGFKVPCEDDFITIQLEDIDYEKFSGETQVNARSHLVDQAEDLQFFADFGSYSEKNCNLYSLGVGEDKFASSCVGCEFISCGGGEDSNVCEADDTISAIPFSACEVSGSLPLLAVVCSKDHTKECDVRSTSEEFTDSNGNGVWDEPEELIDSNGNGVWDRGDSFYSCEVGTELTGSEVWGGEGECIIGIKGSELPQTSLEIKYEDWETPLQSITSYLSGQGKDIKDFSVGKGFTLHKVEGELEGFVAPVLAVSWNHHDADEKDGVDLYILKEKDEGEGIFDFDYPSHSEHSGTYSCSSSAGNVLDLPDSMARIGPTKAFNEQKEEQCKVYYEVIDEETLIGDFTDIILLDFDGDGLSELAVYDDEILQVYDIDILPLETQSGRISNTIKFISTHQSTCIEEGMDYNLNRNNFDYDLADELFLVESFDNFAKGGSDVSWMRAKVLKAKPVSCTVGDDASCPSGQTCSTIGFCESINCEDESLPDLRMIGAEKFGSDNLFYGYCNAGCEDADDVNITIRKYDKQDNLEQVSYTIDLGVGSCRFGYDKIEDAEYITWILDPEGEITELSKANNVFTLIV